MQLFGFAKFILKKFRGSLRIGGVSQSVLREVNSLNFYCSFSIVLISFNTKVCSSSLGSKN